MNVIRCAICLICLLPAGLLSAATIHVPADQPTIQAGVDAAVEGDTVLVADGVWTGPGNRNVLVNGKEITIRSVGGADACIIDCQKAGRGFHFTGGDYWDNPVLRGFTIRNGRADEGGAILVEYAYPEIRQNILEENVAEYRGGAIHCQWSCAIIESNLIQDNHVVGVDGGISGGGGVSFYREGDFFRSNEVRNNQFLRNGSDDAGGGLLMVNCYAGQIHDNDFLSNTAVHGGGIWIESSAQVPMYGNLVSGNQATGDGGGIWVNGTQLFTESNQVMGNEAIRGGGLFVSDVHGSAPWLYRDTFSDNVAERGGGLHVLGPISCDELRVEGNRATLEGGGTYVDVTHSASFEGSLFTGNEAPLGAGIHSSANEAYPLSFFRCTISGNTATESGGAILMTNPSVRIVSSIVWGNAPDEIDVSGGEPEITWSAVLGGFPGEGNIADDPLFASGPLGDHYLSHVAAGQLVDSPCIDAGEPTGTVHDATTRTDSHADHGIADMGYHYPFIGAALVVAGAGPSFYNPSEFKSIYARTDTRLAPLNGDPYSVAQYGVNIAAGDIDGDGFDEVITGPGPAEIFGPHVRAMDINGPVPGVSFLAYGTPKYGVNVGAGDLDGDGTDEILTGAAPGEVYGPHVRAFAFDGVGTTPVPGVSFLAYGTPKWGVNVAGGDIDGDGCDEIITGPGPGAVYGPHVRAWDVDGGVARPVEGLSWFAFNYHRYGVKVTCGDVDGDGIAEIVTAPGPSPNFPAHILGWNVDSGSPVPLPGFNFMAWDWRWTRWGANVWAASDLDDDGRAEIVVGPGPDHRRYGLVNVYDYDDQAVTPWFEYEVQDEHHFGATVTAGWFEMN